MAHFHNKENQQKMASAEPKQRVYEHDFLRMATLTNDVLLLHRSLERDDLYEMLLCLFGSFICEKAFETVYHLEEFVTKYCPFIRIETIGVGDDEKKLFHWSLTGDQSQKDGLDRMAKGTALNRTFEEASD